MLPSLLHVLHMFIIGSPVAPLTAAATLIRMLYQDLSKVVPLDQQTLCLQLLEDIEPSIRWGDDAGTSTMEGSSKHLTT